MAHFLHLQVWYFWGEHESIIIFVWYLLEKELATLHELLQGIARQKMTPV